ncbi:cysteine rich repeat-containing protein [Kaarinaea lacus]
MKSRLMYFILMSLVLFSSTAWSEETIESAVKKACMKEIDSYCKNVTEGQGRLLACFYAHEDKLSAECSFTLYKAASALEQVVAAFNYVAHSCEVDIKTFCSNVKPGEGRIVGCLNKNTATISPACTKALKEVGVK